MRGFKEFFNEAIGIATSCDQFGTASQTKGWWFAGAGSDLGCHKKHKIKTLKYKFNKNVQEESSILEGTPSKFWQTGLNTGSGGGPGKAPPPNPAIDNKKDNSGAGGGSGKSPQPAQPLKNTGCGCGPSAGGPCNTDPKGCSGYMCGDAGSKGATATATTSAPKGGVAPAAAAQPQVQATSKTK